MKKKNTIEVLTDFDRLIDESTAMNKREWAVFFSLHAQSFNDGDEVDEAIHQEENKYLIGYWDMGKFNEVIVNSPTEELAIDSFLSDYQTLHGLQPYIARCETIYEYEQRIAAGDTELPEDGQFERYNAFGNAYYEALNH